MAGDSVDIIIPVFNELAVTKDCLDSIKARSDTPYRLILIDNASDSATKIYLEEFARGNDNAALVRNEVNLGWVKAVNQGIKISTGPYICIMNNDTVVRTTGWLAKLTGVAEMADDIGLVNPRFKVKGDAVVSGPYIEIDFCRGYCVLIKRAVVDKIGALDESYGLGYYDDDDFSLRAIRAGFRCVRADSVLVEHLKDTTFSAVFKDDVRRELHEKNKRLFYSKWGKRLRVVFIVTKVSNRECIKSLLLLLARRQHIIYVWNQVEPFRIAHINIRESRFPGLFSAMIFGMAIRLNAAKKETKRYDLVFTDDAYLGRRLSWASPGVHCVDIEKDAGEIVRMVDSEAKA